MPRASSAQPQVRARDSVAGSDRRQSVRSLIEQRRAAAIDRRKAIVTPKEQIAEAEVRHRELGSRMRRHLRHRHRDAHDRDSRFGFRLGLSSRYGLHLRAHYYDRPGLIHHGPRHVHPYYDPHHRLRHRIIWPRYHYPVYYRFGPRVVFRRVYPYYHRKYVFVSLGGYWPSDYDYVRYYWYGWHPYVWHGYYPVARQVTTQTHNYYTYNYYGDDTSSYSDSSYQTSAPSRHEIAPVDHSTWADVRRKLEQQNASEPAPQTVADTRFEEGVKSFEEGEYAAAARKFAAAMAQAPDDVILPFAHAQALFAAQQYDEAADALRSALRNVKPEKEGVFYPRGLYADDEVLYAQIEKLVDQLDQFGYDADLQLLLGYHLLGVGETGYARQPLDLARQDAANARAAEVLLELVEKVEAEAGDAAKVEPEGAEASESQEESSAAPKVRLEAQTGSGDASQPSQDAGEEPAPKIAEPEVEAAPAQPGSGDLPEETNRPPVLELDEGTSPEGGDSDSAEPVVRLGNAGEPPGLASLGPPGGRGPNRVADLALFALLVFCGSAAVYVQWKLGTGGNS